MLVITGGGGFIGSVLAAQLNEAGRSDLVIVDRFGTGDKWRNIAKRDFDEIVLPEALFDWLERFDDAVETVFHLGAISETTFADADEIIRNNLNYSIALWRWCAARRKRFIYASSAATYGDGLAGFSDEGGIAALKRLRPLNLYGWSKHAFDLWAMRQAAAGTAPPLWAGLKFFNVFGPNEHHKSDMTSLVVKNYPRIIAGETIPLFKSYRPDYADGEQLRDFVYVKDCVAAILWLWRHEPDNRADTASGTSVSGLYNLGTGQARSFLDLMHALGAACGVVPKIEFVDMPDAIRSNYQYFTQAEMTRLRGAGYNAPFTRLEEAVRDCVTQYLAKPDSYL
jgi:ADP-L-glycero-D-manno-heptose 6-epimerase